MGKYSSRKVGTSDWVAWEVIHSLVRPDSRAPAESTLASPDQHGKYSAFWSWLRAIIVPRAKVSRSFEHCRTTAIHLTVREEGSTAATATAGSGEPLAPGALSAQ